MDNSSNNGDLKRPQQQAVSSQHKVPTREEISNSQHIQNNADNGSLPTQDAGFNRKIPRERENEDYKLVPYNLRNLLLTEFSWNLFKNSNTKPNFVISPLSPQILLSYLALAADGPTRNELTKAIGYGSPNQLQAIVTSMLNEPSNRELQIATAFFVSQDMR